MTEADCTIDEVCRDGRIGRRTLDRWLADDQLRPHDDRRFQFHTWRGNKRIWSPAAYLALIAAVERESEPGGVLSSRAERAQPLVRAGAPYLSAAVQSASAKVANWLLRSPR